MQALLLKADSLHFYMHERGLVLRPSLLLDYALYFVCHKRDQRLRRSPTVNGIVTAIQKKIL